jgi:hypothetical protein
MFGPEAKFSQPWRWIKQDTNPTWCITPPTSNSAPDGAPGIGDLEQKRLQVADGVILQKHRSGWVSQSKSSSVCYRTEQSLHWELQDIPLYT